MRKGVDYIGVSVGALIFNEKREAFLNKRSAKTRNEQGSWETPGGVVSIKNPKLRKPCIPVSLRELRTNKMQDLIEKMLDFVYGRSNKGKGERRNKNRPMTVGLSANQLGVLKRISIVDLAIGRKRFNDIHVLVNPKIIWHSKTTLTNREACVNLPEVWGIIRRYKEVKVRAYDRSGNEIIIRAKGWPSILLQHEIDHLNGILFIDRLPNPQRAHFVKENETQKYRRNFRGWKKFIDVSKWARKI